MKSLFGILSLSAFLAGFGAAAPLMAAETPEAFPCYIQGGEQDPLALAAEAYCEFVNDGKPLDKLFTMPTQITMSGRVAGKSGDEGGGCVRAAASLIFSEDGRVRWEAWKEKDEIAAIQLGCGGARAGLTDPNRKGGDRLKSGKELTVLHDVFAESFKAAVGAGAEPVSVSFLQSEYLGRGRSLPSACEVVRFDIGRNGISLASVDYVTTCGNTIVEREGAQGEPIRANENAAPMSYGTTSYSSLSEGFEWYKIMTPNLYNSQRRMKAMEIVQIGGGLEAIKAEFYCRAGNKGQGLPILRARNWWYYNGSPSGRDICACRNVQDRRCVGLSP